MTTQINERIGRVGIDSRKLGIWLFLASEIMFFTGLIGAYIVLRFVNLKTWPVPSSVLNIPLTGINTFILVCSSMTFVMGLASVQKRYQEGLQVGMFLTIALGITFLSIDRKSVV